MVYVPLASLRVVFLDRRRLATSLPKRARVSRVVEPGRLLVYAEPAHGRTVWEGKLPELPKTKNVTEIHFDTLLDLPERHLVLHP